MATMRPICRSLHQGQVTSVNCEDDQSSPMPVIVVSGESSSPMSPSDEDKQSRQKRGHHKLSTCVDLLEATMNISDMIAKMNHKFIDFMQQQKQEDRQQQQSQEML